MEASIESRLWIELPGVDNMVYNGSSIFPFRFVQDPALEHHGRASAAVERDSERASELLQQPGALTACQPRAYPVISSPVRHNDIYHRDFRSYP